VPASNFAQESGTRTPVPAPAFTNAQLTAAPEHNRITNGGSFFNQRFPPLDWINRDNLAELRALWRTSMGSADGEVFVMQIDARLKAFDQRTGEVVWEVDAERWRDSFSITSAMSHHDGLVITEFSGSEMGTRGRIRPRQAPFLPRSTRH